MKIKHDTLPQHALGGQRQLSHFHFGAPGAGEKVYLQAGLHADEIPGMLVLHYLKRLLSRAERRGELRGEIIMVPVANPPGLAQLLLNSGIGRFDLASGRNFNRDFPDLAALAQPGYPRNRPLRAPNISSRCAMPCRRRWRRFPWQARFRPCVNIC